MRSLLVRAGPAARANTRRNARGTAERLARWEPARDALWAVLARHLAPGGRVAVVGAGNGHDLPLARIAERARRVDLIDLDGRAGRVHGCRATCVVASRSCARTSQRASPTRSSRRPRAAICPPLARRRPR